MNVSNLFYTFVILLVIKLNCVNCRVIKLSRKNQNRHSQRASGSKSHGPNTVKYYLDPEILNKLLKNKKTLPVDSTEPPTVTGTMTGTGSATGTMTATGTGTQVDSEPDEDAIVSPSVAVYSSFPAGNRFPILSIDKVRPTKKHKGDRKRRRKKPGRSRKPLYVVRGYNRGSDDYDYDY